MLKKLKRWIPVVWNALIIFISVRPYFFEIIDVIRVDLENLFLKVSVIISERAKEQKRRVKVGSDDGIFKRRLYTSLDKRKAAKSFLDKTKMFRDIKSSVLGELVDATVKKVFPGGVK